MLKGNTGVSPAEDYSRPESGQEEKRGGSGDSDQGAGDHEQPVPTFQPEFFRVPPQQMGMSLWEALGHLSEDLLCGCEAMCLLHTCLERQADGYNYLALHTWDRENQVVEQVSAETLCTIDK